MIDNEIIKALNCCENDKNCSDCPLDKLKCVGKCMHTLISNALDIINSQNSEVEYWKERYERTMENLKAVLEERGDTA